MSKTEQDVLLLEINVLEISTEKYFLLFQLEIDTALSDLEAADFAELVNFLFLFALHSISLPWCHIQWFQQALIAKSISV